MGALENEAAACGAREAELLAHLEFLDRHELPRLDVPALEDDAVRPVRVCVRTAERGSPAKGTQVRRGFSLLAQAEGARTLHRSCQ